MTKEQGQESIFIWVVVSLCLQADNSAGQDKRPFSAQEHPRSHLNKIISWRKMKVRLLAIVSASLILAGCAGSVKPDTVKAANGSAIDIYSVSALPELNDNRIADNTLREVTPTHAAAGMGLAVLGALTGNINSGDFDKEL